MHDIPLREPPYSRTLVPRLDLACIAAESTPRGPVLRELAALDLDALLEVLVELDFDVEILVRPVAGGRLHGRVRVVRSAR